MVPAPAPGTLQAQILCIDLLQLHLLLLILLIILRSRDQRWHGCGSYLVRNISVHCLRVSSGLVTVWPLVRSLVKISKSLPPCGRERVRAHRGRSREGHTARARAVSKSGTGFHARGEGKARPKVNVAAWHACMRHSHEGQHGSPKS